MPGPMPGLVPGLVPGPMPGPASGATSRLLRFGVPDPGPARCQLCAGRGAGAHTGPPPACCKGRGPGAGLGHGGPSVRRQRHGGFFCASFPVARPRGAEERVGQPHAPHNLRRPRHVLGARRARPRAPGCRPVREYPTARCARRAGPQRPFGAPAPEAQGGPRAAMSREGPKGTVVGGWRSAFDPAGPLGAAPQSAGGGCAPRP